MIMKGGYMATQIYLKIKEEILEEIRETPVDTSITSERELAARHQVSRMTVRSAINELVEEGFLYRNKNKGTFVANQKLIKKNTITDSFQKTESDDYAIIYFSVKEADEEIAPYLEIGPRDQIIRIVRLNKINEKPQSVEEIYYLRSMISDKDVNNLDKLLELSNYVEEGSVTQKFLPIIVPVKYINLLHVKLNLPIIMVESTIMNKKGRPLIYIREYNNPFEKSIEITL